MKKSIIFILYISFASCVGFICGVYFGDSYNKNLVSETIAQTNEVRKLMEWYQLIIHHERILKDLEKIHNMNDLVTLKNKYKKSGLRKIGHFKEQANFMKKGAANPSVIIEWENSLKGYEKHFRQLSE